MTTSRIRLVAAVIQLHLVVDDGEHLTPLAVDPLTVNAADWPMDLDAQLAGLQAKLHGDTPQTGQAEGPIEQNGD